MVPLLDGVEQAAVIGLVVTAVGSSSLKGLIREVYIHRHSGY